MNKRGKEGKRKRKKKVPSELRVLDCGFEGLKLRVKKLDTQILWAFILSDTKRLKPVGSFSSTGLQYIGDPDIYSWAY